MNDFFPQGWLVREKLISVSLIVSPHNNKLNKAPCWSFIFYRGSEMNKAPSANISHPVIFGDVALTSWRLGATTLHGKQH